MMNAKRMKIHFKMAVSVLSVLFFCLMANTTLDAQTYYNSQQAVTILKTEIGALESAQSLDKQQTAQTNLTAVKLAYYNAVLNSLSSGVAPAQAIEDNFKLMTATGAEAEYTGFTPVSKTEATTIKNSAIDLISE